MHRVQPKEHLWRAYQWACKTSLRAAAKGSGKGNGLDIAELLGIDTHCGNLLQHASKLPPRELNLCYALAVTMIKMVRPTFLAPDTHLCGAFLKDDGGGDQICTLLNFLGLSQHPRTIHS
jgi:hypothetical protein